MQLKHSFAKQASQGGTDYKSPPFRIRGKDLDENFTQVKPADSRSESDLGYRVNETPDGWELIFDWFPPPVEGTFVLGCVDGQIQWIPTQDCDPDLEQQEEE